MNWIESRLDQAVQRKRGAEAAKRAAIHAPGDRPVISPTAQSWRAALAALAFLGAPVLLFCAWGFADAGHPRWAIAFLVSAAIAAGLYVAVAKSARA